MEVRVYSPTAILGYGFPLESLEAALRLEPDVIGVDAGSTDPGPYYLGEGEALVPIEAVERDLRHLLRASLRAGVPLIVGSAGGAGAKPHVDLTLRALSRAAERLGVRVRVGVAYTDVSKDLLLERLEAGLQGVAADQNSPLGPLRPEHVLASTRIVAQAGVEVVMELLRAGYQVIVAGRVVDVAPFAALPILRGADWGLAVHAAKILECGALAAEPGSGSDGMMAIIRGGEFEVFPVNPARKATTFSVAEHALYERRDPFREHIPGGYVDLSSASYEDSGRGVVVRGSRWVEAARRLVKLEGAGVAGYRVVVIAASRDPGFIRVLDTVLEETARAVRELVGSGGYEVYIRVYGRDGVMGPREPRPVPAHEVAILIEAVADTPELAKRVAALYRSTLLHYGWPGRKTTAGNLAFPLSPSDLSAGRAYRWTVWHLVPESYPLENASLGEVIVGG